MRQINHLHLRTKNSIEINDGLRGTYYANSQIKFKKIVLKSSLFDYSDAYTLVKGIRSVANTTVTDAKASNNDKQVLFKNFTPFTDCISEINNRQIDNSKYIDVEMLMYNLIEYSNNYSKTPGGLWKYYRDEPALNELLLIFLVIVLHLNLS